MMMASSSSSNTVTNPGIYTTTVTTPAVTTSSEFDAESTSTSLKKSLRQIGLASASLGGATSTTTSTAATATTPTVGGAYRLLAQEGGGFDTAKWIRTTRELQQKLQSNEAKQQQQQRSSTKTIGVWDLDTYCRETLQEITQQAIRQAMECSEQSSNRIIQQQLLQDYEDDKKRAIINLMGYHRPTTGTSTYNILPASHKLTYNLVEPHQASLLATSSTTTAQQQHCVVLPESSRRHAAIIQRWNDRQRSQMDHLMEDLHELANDLVRKEAHTSNATKYIAYANAWALLQTLLRHNTQMNNQSTTTTAATLGALEHLCHHYQNLITAQVKEAMATRKITPVTTTKSQSQMVELYVRHFVVMTPPSTNTITTDTNNLLLVLWPTVYYCLRCGNIAAALESIHTLNNNHQVSTPSSSLVEPEVIDLLNNLLPHSNKASTTTNTISSILRNATSLVPSSLRSRILDLYQRIRHRSTVTTAMQQQPTDTFVSSSATIDKYKVATLQLLASIGTTTPATTASPDDDDANTISNTITNNPTVQTIEDYLFTHLWIIASSSTTTSSDRDLGTLGQLLKHWGPSYFEPTTVSSGGWAYAMPLLLAQQYQTALTHLANSDMSTNYNSYCIGLLQATHLAIGLFYAGFPLKDLSIPQLQSTTKDDNDTLFLASLLVSYSKTLQAHCNPEVALEYLVLIPSPTIARQQIQRLLIETTIPKSLDSLIQALSQHFSENQKKQIFEGASMEVSSSTKKAEFLDLAGNYSALLTLFNEELSNHLVMTDTSNESSRKFWYDAAVRFHEEHLSSSSSPGKVLQSLEAEGALGIGRTFQLLLNLMVFFDKCKMGEWQHASQIMDGLGLIPRTDKEIAQMVDVFNQELDSTVKTSMPYILLACVESYYQRHLLVKEQRSSSTISTNQQHLLTQNLAELRQRARTLVTYSGLIPLGNNVPDVRARIARMEAYMI